MSLGLAVVVAENDILSISGKVSIQSRPGSTGLRLEVIEDGTL